MITHVLLGALSGLATSAMPVQMACAQHLGVGAVPGTYATRAEAEAAAKLYNCSGAHPMGNRWMPCTKHPAPAKPGLYPTKAEAEAAAKAFHCTGAHAMGNQWMPCSSHPQP